MLDQQKGKSEAFCNTAIGRDPRREPAGPMGGAVRRSQKGLRSATALGPALFACLLLQIMNENSNHAVHRVPLKLFQRIAGIDDIVVGATHGECFRLIDRAWRPWPENQEHRLDVVVVEGGTRVA